MQHAEIFHPFSLRLSVSAVRSLAFCRAGRWPAVVQKMNRRVARRGHFSSVFSAAQRLCGELLAFIWAGSRTGTQHKPGAAVWAGVRLQRHTTQLFQVPRRMFLKGESFMIRRLLLCALVSALALAAAAQELTLDQIVAKNLQARGGLEKLKSVNSMRITGKMGLGNGMEVTVVTET